MKSAVVATDGGRVRGERCDVGARFHAIPYAAAPIGRRRFLPPQTARAWSGIRDAFRPKQPPAQRPGVVPGGSLKEDCLELTVTTPAVESGRRPVLVWFPIGGFTMGGAALEPFASARLAVLADVVLVVVDTRLGALGYLHLSECGGAAWGAAANVGLQDMVAALRWVQRNIDRFGGDPDNVTIGGQSAAATAVHSLCAMPSARGLFHRAIQHSSGHGAFYGTTEVGTAIAHAMLVELGIPADQSQRLQDVELSSLFDAHPRALRTSVRTHGPMATFCPVVDGDVVPQLPLDAIRGGCMRDIPLLVGVNVDEAVPFFARRDPPLAPGDLQRRVAGLMGRYRDRTQHIIDVYRRDASRSNDTDVWVAIATDYINRVPLTRLAEIHARHSTETRMFLMTWRPADKGVAHHTLELPLLFGRPELASADPRAARVSEHVIAAWSSFMRGEPSCGGAPWPAYEAEHRATLRIDVEPAIERAPLEAERAAWEGLDEAWTDFAHGR